MKNFISGLGLVNPILLACSLSVCLSLSLYIYIVRTYNQVGKGSRANLLYNCSREYSNAINTALWNIFLKAVLIALSM